MTAVRSIARTVVVLVLRCPVVLVLCCPVGLRCPSHAHRGWAPASGATPEAARAGAGDTGGTAGGARRAQSAHVLRAMFRHAQRVRALPCPAHDSAPSRPPPAQNAGSDFVAVQRATLRAWWASNALVVLMCLAAPYGALVGTVGVGLAAAPAVAYSAVALLSHAARAAGSGCPRLARGGGGGGARVSPVPLTAPQSPVVRRSSGGGEGGGGVTQRRPQFSVAAGSEAAGIDARTRSQVPPRRATRVPTRRLSRSRAHAQRTRPSGIRAWVQQDSALTATRRSRTRGAARGGALQVGTRLVLHFSTARGGGALSRAIAAAQRGRWGNA